MQPQPNRQLYLFRCTCILLFRLTSVCSCRSTVQDFRSGGCFRALTYEQGWRAEGCCPSGRVWQCPSAAAHPTTSSALLSTASLNAVSQLLLLSRYWDSADHSVGKTRRKSQRMGFFMVYYTATRIYSGRHIARVSDQGWFNCAATLTHITDSTAQHAQHSMTAVFTRAPVPISSMRRQ